MKTLPPEFAAALAGGATTLARCWRITRRDGAVLALTEHDEDLAVDGTVFRAAGGVSGSETATQLGFAVDGGEMSAALTDEAMTEADLDAGRYDGAWVELLLADWSAPVNFIALRRARIGEVRREDGRFVAELRGLAEALNVVRGRLFASSCDADLGDARCGVALAGGFTGTGGVSAVEGPALLRAGGLESFAAGFFTQGRLTFTSGANTGVSVEVKTHAAAGGVVRLELWQRPPEPMMAGDPFTVTAGCDKRFATCRTRFGNALNFRGMPHMPGNDAVLKVARPGGL
ncbi:DUF2163 domain-containing protein [Ancylobacter sp. G4_0304]|uniref:DUF2163 domain-containing protein n=1 Tax=Ancylobacter sp. G4_0304 TaxID=3114289 RepID=UPI0039C69E80